MEDCLKAGCKYTGSTCDSHLTIHVQLSFKIQVKFLPCNGPSKATHNKLLTTMNYCTLSLTCSHYQLLCIIFYVRSIWATINYRLRALIISYCKLSFTCAHYELLYIIFYARSSWATVNYLLRALILRYYKLFLCALTMSYCKSSFTYAHHEIL